jgi:hypothetical protein
MKITLENPDFQTQHKVIIDTPHVTMDEIAKVIRYALMAYGFSPQVVEEFLDPDYNPLHYPDWTEIYKQQQENNNDD